MLERAGSRLPAVPIREKARAHSRPPERWLLAANEPQEMHAAGMHPEHTARVCGANGQGVAMRGGG